MSDHFVRLHAHLRPHSTAVATLGGEITYQRFDQDIDRMAAALSEADVAPGQRVAVRLAEPYLHWLTLLALSRLAVTSASLGSLQSAEASAVLNPDCVIVDVDPGSLPLPQNCRVIQASAEWAQAVLRREPAAPRARAARDPDALGRILLSSGTTGLPKKLAHTWRDQESRTGRLGLQTGPLGSLDRVLSAIGPEAGSWPTCLAVWALGSAMLIAPPRPNELAAALPRLRPSALLLAPVQLRMLLQALPPGFLPQPDLYVGAAGSHTPLELQREARLRLTPSFWNLYASSETGIVARAHASQIDGDPTLAGWLMPWADVEVVDEDDAPLPAGSSGRLRLRGPEVASEYLDDPEATARHFKDGWFYPGDIGSVSEEGMLRVFGRTDELMNFGGEKFLPMTIEAPVLALEGVIDAAAFAREDDKGLPTPWIAVVKGEGFDDQALARALAIPALPPVHVVWTDRIPRNATGKAQRDILREAAGKARPQGAA